MRKKTQGAWFLCDLALFLEAQVELVQPPLGRLRLELQKYHPVLDPSALTKFVGHL